MTAPTVTETTSPPEPVSRDPFLDDGVMRPPPPPAPSRRRIWD
jgi:hypothetical protein